MALQLQLLAATPVEALVLRHRAALGGSLWTWLAVLAAALGLWRIRSAAAAPKPEPASRRAGPPRGGSGHNLVKAAAGQLPPSSPTFRATTAPPSPTAGAADSPKKGTVFELCGYDGEEENGVADDSAGEEEEGGGGETREGQRRVSLHRGGGDVAGRCGEWRRRSDLGWYGYQDMAALNGRVVKLWEDERGVATARLKVRRRLQDSWRSI